MTLALELIDSTRLSSLRRPDSGATSRYGHEMEQYPTMSLETWPGLCQPVPQIVTLCRCSPSLRAVLHFTKCRSVSLFALLLFAHGGCVAGEYTRVRTYRVCRTV